MSLSKRERRPWKRSWNHRKMKRIRCSTNGRLDRCSTNGLATESCWCMSYFVSGRQSHYSVLVPLSVGTEWDLTNCWGLGSRCWRLGSRCTRNRLFIVKSIKRELKTRPTYDCRCDERLEPKDDGKILDQVMWTCSMREWGTLLIY